MNYNYLKVDDEETLLLHNTDFCKAVGTLPFLTKLISPGISAVVNMLSRRNEKPT